MQVYMGRDKLKVHQVLQDLTLPGLGLFDHVMVGHAYYPPRIR